ncbi:hypothetical protein Trydic_g6007 [Trypoxylus dichotomus]
MGAPASKFGQEIEEEAAAQGSLPSTPILTPKTRLVDLDPRSPSENIVRTPIEMLLAKKTLQAPCDESILLQNTDKIYSPSVKLKNIDPRSPTIDFTRTPIVVPEEDCQLPLKLHNKNLDNARRALDSPLTAHLKKKLPDRRPPKLLESVLETNLDCIETDLDTIKPKVNPERSTEEFDNILEDEEIIAERGSVIDQFATPPQNPSKSNYQYKDICLNDVSDPRSPSTQFIRTPIPLLQKLETLEMNDDSCDIEMTARVQILNTCDENDDGLRITQQKSKNSPETTSKSNSDTIDNRISQENENKLEIIKDFDKKLTNLIYEDKEKSETISKNKRFTYDKSRMPLSIRNSNTNLGKGSLKLKVRDKPRKCGKDLSKIPIFQNKGNKIKFHQQCENTPPINVGNKKAEKLQWDPDNTIII